MTTSSYSDEFRIKAVDAFVAYFQASSGLTSAARMAAEEFGIAPSTVRTWAEEQGRTPTPTWGEIRRLRAQNAILSSRLAKAQNTEQAAVDCPDCGGDLG